MKKTILTLVVTLASMTASAASVPSYVSKVAAGIKANDTRTISKELKRDPNDEGNPCIPDGKVYKVELQVKQPAYDGIKRDVIYSWETVKTVLVDDHGRVMEVCGE